MKKDILSEISEAIVSMNEKTIPSLCRQTVEERYPVRTILDNGLLHGMELVGAKYETGEYFVPEFLLCSDALNAGLEVIKPLLSRNTGNRTGHIVLGVISGDAHDIGKGIVRIMLEGAGFIVTDLGRDVAYADFVNAAVEKDADIIGISSLITTAMARVWSGIITSQRCLHNWVEWYLIIRYHKRMYTNYGYCNSRIYSS